MIHLIFKLFSLLIFSKADFESSSNTYTSSEQLGYKEGYVGNESFIYYYIHHSGNIILSLTSNRGDADMYISDSRVFPTYYPESYDLHSATCGVEIIEIPPGFNSPIAVGVYGHSAHELSSYVLEVFKKPETERAFAIIEDELPQDVQDTISVPNEEVKVKNPKAKARKKVQQISSKVNGFFSLFEILGLVFL